MNHDETRTEEVRENLCALLEMTFPTSMLESQWLEKINRKVSPPVSRAEFDDAVNWLCAVKRYICTVPNLSDATLTRWIVTRDGINWLRAVGK